MAEKKLIKILGKKFIRRSKQLFVIFRLIDRIKGIFKIYFDYYYLKYHGVDTSLGYVTLYGLPIINKYPGSKIILGKGATLVSKTRYNIAGINHPVILATLSNEAIIKIGYVGLSGVTLCSAKMIEIKNFSGVGANSKLYDTDFHTADPVARKSNVGEIKSSPIIIEENVWIAADVTILKGVHIGEGSVIGCASVVTKDVPSFELHAGNPARRIRDLKLKK